jgi:hypothetical protein
MAEPLKDVVDLTRQRRDASALWMQDNFYGEWSEVMRASKCLTKPIMARNKSGKMVEDKTRTNVAMPDISRIIRQNTARLTVNPPQLNYLCSDPEVAQKLSAWRYQQFDRSGEAQVRRRHIQQEETFGWSVTKSFWDKITATKSFRHPAMKGKDADGNGVPNFNVWTRANVMEAQGAPQDEIKDAVAKMGQLLTPEEFAVAMSKLGDELTISEDITRHAGPRVKWCFVGDIYPEPGFENIHRGWILEQYTETDTWLEDMAEKTYEDEDGNDVPIFDKKACAELAEDDSTAAQNLTRRVNDLRRQFREVLGKTDPNQYQDQSNLIKGKRFLIYETHEQIDGKWWINWVGNDKVALGKMPYQHDLEGLSYYTPFTGLPDLLVGIGDSTPRLMRFLYNLHNASVAQAIDLNNQILRRTVLRAKDADMPDEAVERAFYRVLDVKRISDFQVVQEPDIPAGAFQVQGMIKSEQASLEPSLFTADSGTPGSPMAGKTATTGVLAQRSNDALLQYKIDELAAYDRELGYKELWMMQQEQPGDQPIKINKRYAKTEALSHLFGSTSVIELSPYEVQEDITIEPAVGATLSADDEFHRMAWERLYQLAEQDPMVWNKTEVAKGYAQTIRGADATKLVNPPTPPPPPPPKVTLSITAKFESLPSGVQASILQGQGLQLTPEDEQELQHQDSLRAVKEVGDAADAAAKLAQPADQIAAQAKADSALAHQNADHAAIQENHKAKNDVLRLRASPAKSTGGSSGASTGK